VLTEFSDVSRHAAEYAAALSRQFGCRRIVLFHAYEVVLPVSSASVTGQLSYTVLEDIYDPENERVLREASWKGLTAEAERLKAFVDEGTVIEIAAEQTRLPAIINEAVARQGAGLVVMGISDRAGLDQWLFGGDALAAADQSPCPVLVVPMQAAPEPVTRVVLAYDLEKPDSGFPGKDFCALLDEFHADLRVVHVDKTALTEELGGPGGMPELRALLEPYRPVFDFIEHADTATGIIDYAERSQASLIAVVGRHHSFIGGLFHKSVTHQVARHTPIPVLVLHAGM